MKISFDLDDTLIPSNQGDFFCERRNWFQKIIQIELVRKDTAVLFKSLRKNGHTVGIYTSSYRKRIKILVWAISYGFRPNFVINEYISRPKMKALNLSGSKFPPAFGIDLHVDDSEGVRLEGSRLGFRTLIIEKQESNWVQKVIQGV